MVSTPADRESASSYRWVILAIAVLAYATSQGARQNYTGIQKFIAGEFQLDKAELGVLGSMFFYAYALFQMPWGVAADKYGSRAVTTIGILLTAATMAGFATSGSKEALMFWRGASGVAGAAAWVSMAGGIARWFPGRERGMSQSALAGVGGAIGEVTGFFVLPLLSVYFVSWRYGANVIAVAMAVVALLCLIFFRASPTSTRATAKAAAVARSPFTLGMLGDTRLWSYTLLHSGCMVGIRISQAWLGLYAADVYIAARGFSLNAAVVAAGFLATMGYSLLGHGLGVAALGRISDALLKRGISRTMLAIGSLAITVMSFQLLSMGPEAIWFLWLVAIVLGVTVNSFTLVVADASEAYGPERTGSVSSFMNTVGQIMGATALAVSGYIGMGLSAGSTGSLNEYQGIWLSGMAWIVALTVAGSAFYYVAFRNRSVPASVAAPM